MSIAARRAVIAGVADAPLRNGTPATPATPLGAQAAVAVAAREWAALSPAATMTAADFPVPVEDPESTPYWSSLREHAMQLPYCPACQSFFFDPRTVCPQCQGQDTEWRAASERGVIYSYTVVRRAPSPAFAAEVPYTVALADLDEGCRIVARVAPEDASRAAVGGRVRIGYQDITDTRTLPVLHLADPSPESS